MIPLWMMQWLLACAGSVAAGLGAWLLLRAAAHPWPALRTRRNVWLAAQAVVAAAVLLPFLPQSAGFSLTPRIELDMPAIASRSSDEALDADTLPAPVASVAGAAETAPIATARAAKARTGAASDATPTATPITAP